VLDNLTPFGAAAAFAYDVDDTQVVVLCVAARFEMPAAGSAHDGPLRLSEQQAAPPMGDVHAGDPARSSLRLSGQGVPCRPGAEIYLQGSAWAPRGRAVTAMQTRVRVGACRKDVRVVGDRYWRSGFSGLRPTAPEPFTSMLLCYEHAFGGTATMPDGRVTAHEPRNPIGRGIYARSQDAIDQRLPNLEKPGESVMDVSDRLTPWGYGPIPGAWQPRLAWSGTYDERWQKTRLPLWPQDIDRRFFCAAAPGLTFDSRLRGDELVILDGFDPDGVISFPLARRRLMAKSYFGDRTERRLMSLEAVLFDMEPRTAVLFWRAAVPLGRGRGAHLQSVVRTLEPWEGPLQ